MSSVILSSGYFQPLRDGLGKGCPILIHPIPALGTLQLRNRTCWEPRKWAGWLVQHFTDTHQDMFKDPLKPVAFQAAFQGAILSQAQTFNSHSALRHVSQSECNRNVQVLHECGLYQDLDSPFRTDLPLYCIL